MLHVIQIPTRIRAIDTIDGSTHLRFIDSADQGVCTVGI